MRGEVTIKINNIKLPIFILAMVFSISVTKSIIVYAESNRDNLRQELEKQEQKLEEELKPLNPVELDITKTLYQKAIDEFETNASNATGEINIQEKTDEIQKVFFKSIINTRTIAIYGYIGIWVIGILYAATFGSRDVNKRRKVYLYIRNSTVLFLVYINIPLFIIWFNAYNKELFEITGFNLTYDTLLFLQRNSLIISALMFYSGKSRIIISKNDLPMRKQGKYLIKFSIIVLILLNLAPISMYFLI